MPGSKQTLLAIACCLALPTLGQAQESSLAAAQRVFDKGEVQNAVDMLLAAAAKEPNNGDIQVLLTKSRLELQQYDAAVTSGEKAVSLNPQNSDYHRLLGEAYGAKADHASMLSAFGWARKTVKEFEIAVQLDEKNFDSAQDLVEYYCTAPSVVGGGVDKAQPVIQKLMSLDAAQGHYASGNCHAAKKEYASADGEFAKALESKPKSADLVFNMGDYFLQRGQADKLIIIADTAETLAPADPRAKYYRAAGWILKSEKFSEAEKLLQDYLKIAPPLSSYPKPWEAHYWLGRSRQAQKDVPGARSEYEISLKLNSKYKKAQEALKQLEAH
jgi:tetratricopeptide (TPR) repeat protein